jgi:hypothetical protein
VRAALLRQLQPLGQILFFQISLLLAAVEAVNQVVQVAEQAEMPDRVG